MRQKLAAIKIQGISGAVLKWIAIVTMLIDHIGAAVLEQLYIDRGNRWGNGLSSYEFDAVLRVVGRLAFPIFCFLLAEGLFHTRNRWKYLLRLLVFALISEVPFDLAFFQSWWTLRDQNVFFTLALGFSACAVWDWVDKVAETSESSLLPGLAKLLVVGAAILAAKWIHSDYQGMGVSLILTMYLFWDKPRTRDFVGICLLGLMVLIGAIHWSEMFAAFSFPLFHLYNGKRGRQPKYFFYVFYPAHLLLLCGLRVLVQ